MVKLTITGNDLVVELDTWDRIWALRRRFELPLPKVTSVRIDSTVGFNPRGIRWPGTHWPGKIAAGTYRSRDGNEFWSRRSENSPLVIELDGAEFRRVVLDVDDPDEMVTQIEAAHRRVDSSGSL